MWSSTGDCIGEKIEVKTTGRSKSSAGVVQPTAVNSHSNQAVPSKPGSAAVFKPKPAPVPSKPAPSKVVFSKPVNLDRHRREEEANDDLSLDIPELFDDWRNQVDMPKHGLLGPVTWIPEDELEGYDFEYDEFSGEEIKKEKEDYEPEEMDDEGI